MDTHVVDDNEQQLELFQEIAEVSGLTAQGFSSSEEYLEYVALENYNPPRLTIVTDVRMPGKSGYELMTEIRKNRPEIRFVVVTGTAEDIINDNERACFYLTKPVSLSRLRKIFETISYCVEYGHQPDIFECEALSDLSDFNITDWHCPHKRKPSPVPSTFVE